MMRRRRQTTTRARPRQQEHSEQVRVVHWLRAAKIAFCAVPNGGYALSPQAGARMVAAGLSKGFPDLLVFDVPPNAPEFVGTAIEMKRADGGTTTNEQQDWLIALAARGWATKVCAGAADALSWLAQLGYRVPAQRSAAAPQEE